MTSHSLKRIKGPSECWRWISKLSKRRMGILYRLRCHYFSWFLPLNGFFHREWNWKCRKVKGLWNHSVLFCEPSQPIKRYQNQEILIYFYTVCNRLTHTDSELNQSVQKFKDMKMGFQYWNSVYSIIIVTVYCSTCFKSSFS